MQLNWRQVYSELTDFIARHPEIKIGDNVIRIPNDYRSEFYSLHKKTRTVFIEEKTPDLLKKSKALSKNYIKVEEEVAQSLELQGISVAPSLARFLHHPIDQLIQESFNPLFHLLKGQIDIEKYEAVASQNIETFFKSLYRSGYEKWVILSLVKLLEADKAFHVIPEEVTEEDTMKHGGLIDFKIPAPEESAKISFRRETEVGFMVPDLIIHSAVANNYLSFTSEIIKAWALATNASNKREWLPGDSTVVFEGGIILVYVDKNLEDLSLVTDATRTCRADLIIECREQKDWYEKEGLGKVKLHYDKYKPRLGTYIVTIEPVPEQVHTDLISEKAFAETTSKQSPDPAGRQEFDKNSPQIHLLTVGFDHTKLKTVINALV